MAYRLLSLFNCRIYYRGDKWTRLRLEINARAVSRMRENLNSRLAARLRESSFERVSGSFNERTEGN
jgi:hypothetical protein